MKRFLFLTLAALVLLFVQSAFAQTEELPDTVWTKFTYPNAVNAVKFTPDGKYLASGGDDGIPKLWDAETGKLVYEFPILPDIIEDIDISNRYIAFSSRSENGINVYDLNTKELLVVLKGSSNVAFSSDGNYLVTATHNTTGYSGLSVYNTNNWQLLNSIGLQKTSFDIKVSKDNNYIVRSGNWGDPSTENKEGTIELYSLPELSYIRTIEKKEYLACHQLAFSPDGKYLAAAITDSPNKIWNTSDWSLVSEFGGNGESKSICFSQDSKYVVTGKTIGGKYWHHLFIYDAENGEEKYNYVLNYHSAFFGNEYGGVVRCIDIDKKSEKIVSGTGVGFYLLNAKWNPTSVQENPVQIIEPIVFPNPTNSTANIRFDLLNSTSINIQIYDINSRLITQIFDGFLESGNHNYEWNTEQAPSDIYFARITASGNVSTIKIIVNK